MTALPEWAKFRVGAIINIEKIPVDQELLDLMGRYHEALVIAWEAMEQANHWQNVKGLSPTTALDQVDIDLRSAMRRITELGKE